MRVLKPEIQNRLLIAARKEFIGRGYALASLRSIARECNMTVGNIYRYYDSKYALFLAVVEKVTLNRDGAAQYPQEFALIAEKRLTDKQDLINRLSQLDIDELMKLIE